MDPVTPNLLGTDACGGLANSAGSGTPSVSFPSDFEADKTCVNTPVIVARAQAAVVADRLGRYEILKKLGEGGMGAVYHALDTATGQEVALKVLAEGCLAQPQSLRRFEKEARLLEAAKSPHVANLLDVGTDGDTRFLVMEYVRGGDLRGLLKQRGSLDESFCLEIVSDLCKALVTAHVRGLVHRDIKPENALLEVIAGESRPTVKLTDFGLARHVDQSESLKLTQTGTLLGTPYYMAPEQFTGSQEISPATDVYAIGVTFYELLTGQRPFPACDPIQLATAHCFEEAPDVRRASPLVSDATANLIRRMLAKHPGQRPPDASTVLEEILRLQTGDSSQFVIHPVLPAHEQSHLVTAEFEWSLESSPAELWPLISNTDRINHATGLQPVTYETFTETDGRVRRFGQFKLGGIKIRWEEHPFEWIEGQRFSILREFPSGPFQWFMSDVELVPRADGGTDLKHRVKVEPRGMLGRIIAKIELGSKSQRKLECIYRRIDMTVSGKTSSSRVADPFQIPPEMKRVQLARLDQRLNELAALNVSSGAIDAIRDLVLNASIQDLARLQPYAVARRFDLPEQDVVEAFLRSASLGLMTLHWDIICPTCRMATDTKGTLREIEQHANCSACQVKFDIEFGSSLELIFRIHPEIRTTNAKTYCTGGPGNFPHVVAQVRLGPGERLVVPVALDSGSYVARGPSLPYAVPVVVDQQEGLRHAQIKCLPGPNRTPVATLRAGHQNIAFENYFPCEQLIRIERVLRRSEALTASQATGLSLFQSLFPEQTLAPGMLIEVATSNFLALKMNGLDEAFGLLGDVKTYSLAQDFWRIVEHQVLINGGVMVDKTVDSVLCSFSDPVIAVEAAHRVTVSLSSERPEWCWSISGALHRGAAIVTANRNEVSYFGATINHVRKRMIESGQGQLVLTREVWSDPGVSAAFADQLQLASDGIAAIDVSIRLLRLNTLTQQAIVTESARV